MNKPEIAFFHKKRWNTKKIPNLKLMGSYILFQVFTSQEEGSLKDHIVKMTKMFYGLDKVKVRRLAYEFPAKENKKIPESWQKNGCAGEDWLKGFRRRVGDLSLRTPELISLAQAMAFKYNHCQKQNQGLKSNARKSVLQLSHQCQ